MKLGKKKIVAYLDDDVDMLEKAREIRALSGISSISCNIRE